MKRTKRIFGKKIIGVVACILFSFSIVSALLIQQVQVAPVEVVQILNDGSESVSLASLTIATEASLKDATLSGILPPGGLYTIGDPGAIPDLDHEETISLYNSDSGVAIMNGSIVIDSVGWGDSNNIESGLFSGTPVVNPEEGSLFRVSNTGDNSVDFVLSTPDFSRNVFRVNVSVPEISPPSISTVFISDSAPRDGVQFILSPGKNKLLSVNVTGENLLNVSVTMNGIVFLLNSSETTAFGEMNIPFTTPPGMYDVVVQSGSSSKIVRVEVLPLFSLDVSKRFVSASVSDVLLMARGVNIDIFPRVSNLGNVPLNIRVHRNNAVLEKGVLRPGQSLTVDFELVTGEVYIVGTRA